MNDGINSNDCSIIRLIKSRFARCDNDTKYERWKKHTLNLNFLKRRARKMCFYVFLCDVWKIWERSFLNSS